MNLSIFKKAVFFVLVTVLSVWAGGGKKDAVFVVDTSRSVVHWQCDKHSGTVRLFGGKLAVRNGKLADGAFSINMASLVDEDIDYELMRLTLQNILKSEEFFWIEKYPEARYKILFVHEESGNTAHITGDLTVRGVTAAIGFDAAIEIKGDTLTAKTERFCMDRTKWGIMSMSAKVATSDEQFIVPDQIYLTIELYAVRE